VNRALAWSLVVVMLLVVAGQAMQLQRASDRPVNQIELHDSRLVPFLQEIRSSNPDTYDSLLLNITRIRDGQAQVQNYQLEEQIVAERLIARLTGSTAPAQSQPARD
jgi:hypothetical protein